MFSLTFAVSFLADKVHVIAIVFSLFVSLLCLFVLFISFNHKMIIKEESLIIKQFRTVKINFREILEIKGNEKFTNDNVIFIHTNEIIIELAKRVGIVTINTDDIVLFFGRTAVIPRTFVDSFLDKEH